MSAALTMLRAEDAGAVPEVVELLREALQRAESGEIIGVGIVVACSRRCGASSYSIGSGNIASLVLACRRLERRLLDHEEL